MRLVEDDGVGHLSAMRKTPKRRGALPPPLPVMMAELALASWETIARRTYMMVGGSCAPAEYRRMVLEKTQAAQRSAMMLMTGGAHDLAAALEPWHRRATANARRLRRRREPLPPAAVAAEQTRLRRRVTVRGNAVLGRMAMSEPQRTSPAGARWQPAASYPDPAIEILDPSFAKYRVFNAAVERLAIGFRWCEGPVWFGDGRYLLWSDIPNDRILRWDEETGAVSIFRKPSNNANGNTRDRQGRLVTCEHGGRRVTRTELDGSVTVLADRFEGKRLNSPNDVVVKSDGSIWFTDPPFGILGNYEGDRAPSEIHPNVYRIDGRSGVITLVADEMNAPNGICFSPDESKIYIVDSRATPHPLIRVHDVVADGTRLAHGRVFVDGGEGTNPDGFRCDIDGNLWCGWGTGQGRNGVMVYAPSGQAIGRVALPERCANLCFGGRKRNRLFMAASQSLYALYVNTQGVPYF